MIADKRTFAAGQVRPFFKRCREKGGRKAVLGQGIVAHDLCPLAVQSVLYTKDAPIEQYEANLCRRGWTMESASHEDRSHFNAVERVVGHFVFLAQL